MLSESFPIHLLIIILCLPASFFLLRALKELKYAGIIVKVIVALLLILLNTILFSIAITFDHLDSVVNVYIYNWWSLFLRTQVSATILYLSFELWRRFKKHE